MKRREFIVGLGGLALQQGFSSSALARQPVVGFLGSGTAASQKRVVEAFVERLRELGWSEGRNIAIEYRWAEGQRERARETASELVRLNVDAMVASGVASVMAAKQATSTIPIVFAVVNDPLGTGVVASLSRPGGNVTGLSLQNPDLVGKRVELLREILPGLHRLAIMANANNPGALLEAEAVQSLAPRIGLETVRIGLRKADEIAAAFDLAKRQAGAVYVCTDAFMIANRQRLAASALASQVPTMCALRECAEAGALISYGADNANLFRRAGDYVEKILRGTHPGELPVEQPTKFEFVINLKTAKALGLTVPPALLARADQVIE